MSTIEQQQNELERLQKLLSDFLSESPDTFVRKDLNDVPYVQLKRIADHISRTYENLTNILEFSIQKYPQNAVVTRNQFLDNIRDGYDQLSNVITPTISYLATQQTDFGKLKQSALENLEEIKKLKSEFEKQQEDIKEQSNSILDSMRKASAETGVTQHAIHFKEESELHENSARFWFWLTIGIALLTIVASYLALSYFYANPDLPTGQSIQLGISKLVVLSVLYFGILWASRNY